MSALARASVTRPAALLVTGRVIGLVASFGIGIVLARVFSPAIFGTYKQFFLVYGTLYGLAQLGMAESLYYFVPRDAAKTGRYVCNALITLGFAGLVCLGLLHAWRAEIAARLSNAGLADYMWWLGLFLTLMLMSTVLEIVMVSRKQHLMAAVTYACSDVARTLCLILPALLFTDLRAVFIGATAFAALRLALLVAALWREYGRDFRVDIALWRRQLAYALPFALAVGVEVLQVNFHQYVVASRFDAATFAIYSVGCLQIPLVDVIMTSTGNVLMVRMAEEASHGEAAVALWHETICRLAFLMVPLSVLLVVVARELIVSLYTTTYLASVPIFVAWSLNFLPSIFAVNAVLRVYAQTRFLIVMNVMRLALVAGLIGWFLAAFGMTGAVLVTLLSTALINAVGVMRIAYLLRVSPAHALPWARLAGIFARAGLAAIPVLALAREVTLTPAVGLVVGSLLYGAGYFGLTYAPAIAERLISPARPDPRTLRTDEL